MVQRNDNGGAQAAPGGLTSRMRKQLQREFISWQKWQLKADQARLVFTATYCEAHGIDVIQDLPGLDAYLALARRAAAKAEAEGGPRRRQTAGATADA